MKSEEWPKLPCLAHGSHCEVWELRLGVVFFSSVSTGCKGASEGVLHLARCGHVQGHIYLPLGPMAPQRPSHTQQQAGREPCRAVTALRCLGPCKKRWG